MPFDHEGLPTAEFAELGDPDFTDATPVVLERFRVVHP